MADKTGKKQGTPNASPITISSCAFLLCTFWLALLILDRLIFAKGFKYASGSLPGIITLAAAAIAVIFAAAKYRVRLYQILTAKPFAATILIWLLGFTILGTLIVQTGSREELAEAYGAKWSELIFRSGLNDLFHSLWFGGFLILLAISLILVVVKRRSWRFREWGNLLSHLGVVAILIGGFIGYFFGFKGVMGLHIGESANQAIETKRGIQTRNVPRLGFSIGLADFTIERYAPEYKIYLHQAGKDSFKVKQSFDLKKAQDWVKINSSGASFRIVHIYPDFYFETGLKESASADARPALQLEIADGHSKKIDILFAGTDDMPVTILPDQSALRFEWERAEGEDISVPSTDPEHIIVFEKSACCPEKQLAVKAGKEYLIEHGGLYKVRDIQFLPDFVFDLATHKPATRSQEPNNPALQIEITTLSTGAREDRWLFAKHPEFAATHGSKTKGPHLAYEYHENGLPPQNELVIIGKTREAVELENGKMTNNFPLPADGQPIPGTNIESFKIFANAEAIQKPATRSEQMRNPAVDLEIKPGTGSKVLSTLLASQNNGPLVLPDNEHALELRLNSQDVKSYRSRLAVIDEGKKAAEKTVSVNHPLSYHGYSFYQSKYDKDDPTYSELLVVRDPGLSLVWLGFGMVCAGLIFIYYIKPGIAGSGETNVN